MSTLASPSIALVVDDEEDIRELVAMWLRGRGLIVRLEADGAAGLESALAGDVDLVVLDWNMPGLDGPEVCRRLRADPAGAGLPILMVTARTNPHDAQDALRAGADAYLPKPFTRDRLLRAVDALLARWPQGERR